MTTATTLLSSRSRQACAASASSISTCTCCTSRSPSDFDATIASYNAAEKLLAEGRVRAIGVCNHSSQHLECLISQSKVTPAVNQIELHPYFTQQHLRAFHARHGITSQAWSPLGGVNVYRPADPDHPKNPLQDAVILDLASRHYKTPAQVILRWHIDHGRQPSRSSMGSTADPRGTTVAATAGAVITPWG